MTETGTDVEKWLVLVSCCCSRPAHCSEETGILLATGSIYTTNILLNTRLIRLVDPDPDWIWIQ
jgi:hypothetical protein